MIAMRHLVATLNVVVVLSLGSTAVAQESVDTQDPISETPIGNFGARLAYNSNLGLVAGANFVTATVFGLPHQLALSTDISKSDQRLSFDYVIPSVSQDRPAWGLSVFRNDTRATDAYDFNTLSYGLRPKWSRQLSETAQISVQADLSKDEISNLGAGSSMLIANDLGPRNRAGLLLRYQWQQDQTSLRFSTVYSSTSIGSSFVKSEASLSRDWSFGSTLVLSSSLNLGHLAMRQGQSNIGDRFFMSGGQLRGFGLAGLGPRDLAAGNAALGGNSYAAVKFDLGFPKLMPDQDIFVPGVFVDMGSLWGLDNVAGGPGGGDPVDAARYLRSTAGLSAKFDLGPALLSIYAARALQKQSYDIESQFQVNLSARF